MLIKLAKSDRPSEHAYGCAFDQLILSCIISSCSLYYCYIRICLIYIATAIVSVFCKSPIPKVYKAFMSIHNLCSLFQSSSYIYRLVKRFNCS